MEIDARGIACPQPVLMAKRALDKMEEGVITILVDNKGSSVNVKNFCEANGHTVTVTEEDGVYKVEVVKGYECVVENESSADSNIVVFISGECVGNEEPELGKMLMKGFIGNLKNMDTLPKTVILVNNSVRMVTTNEETIPLFQELVDKGIELLACGACLDYFKLVDDLKTGKVTDAHTVASRLFKADKVIRL